MEPAIQGQLDGFCGIYSVVNATRGVARIGSGESQRLFWKIFSILEPRKPVSRFVRDGISDRDMGYIFRNLVEQPYGLKATRAFRDNRVPLGIYWETIQEFLEEGEARAVILVLESWDWSHWTVVQRATARTLFLFDSYNLVRVQRKRATTARLVSGKDLLFYPRMTRLIYPRG
jgi:hypothetical protein